MYARPLSTLVDFFEFALILLFTPCAQSATFSVGVDEVHASDADVAEGVASLKMILGEDLPDEQAANLLRYA